MTFGKHIWGEYERAIRDCHSSAADTGTIPGQGLWSAVSADTAGAAKNPSLLVTAASKALEEGKRKVDEHRGQCINNSVNNYVNNSPIFDLPLTSSVPGTQVRPTTPQSLPITITPIVIPELGFMDDCMAYCDKRIAYLRKLSLAIDKWDEWTHEISEYYKTGIVKENDGDLTALERTTGGKGRQIKRDYLTAYFTELKNTDLYSNNNETTKAVEDVKNRVAEGGASQVRGVVASAQRNNFCGATFSLSQRITGFETAKSSIQTYRTTLSNYISATSSCAATAIVDPFTGSFRLGG